MRIVCGLVWLSGCSLDPSGDWYGERACTGEEAQAMEVTLGAMGGFWQGPGLIEWGNTHLGAQVLHFDLELRQEGGAWKAELLSCRFEWAAQQEDTACLDASLTYEVEDDPVSGTLHLLTGDLGGCPVLLTLD